MKIAYEALPLCIGIIGSRSFEDNARAATILQEHIDTFVSKLDPRTEIVSGGARGVDSWGEASAKKYKLHTTIYHPDKSIGIPLRYFQRNKSIVRHVEKKEGAIAAFVDISNCEGTYMTLRLARRTDVPLLVFRYKSSGLFIKWTD